MTDLTQLSRVTAERDSLIEQVKAMTGVSAELSRVKAELGEANAAIYRLCGTLKYIKAQTLSTAYVSAPKLALSVIRSNAEAALDEGFQASVAEARSFLSRMEGAK